ncbi:MAG: hypothetical protein ABI042_00785, partial [Verrucomicrobiota bacterium]
MNSQIFAVFSPSPPSDGGEGWGEEVMLLRFCGEGFWGVERTSMETKSKSSRRYDAEFKENAVALVQSGR